jgi:hypothetical protein
MDDLQVQLEMAHHHAMLGAEAIHEFISLLELKEYLVEYDLSFGEKSLSLQKEVPHERYYQN